MIVDEFQKMNSIPTGATYDDELITLFKVNKNQSVEKVLKELESALKVTPHIKLKKYLKVNGTFYTYEKEVLECTYEQFNRLEMILNENNNIQNLHKLLAIYVRPINMFGRIKKYNLNTQEKIAEQLQQMNMDTAQSLMLFFYQSVNKYLKYIRIHFLNERKMNMTESTKNK